MLRRRLTGLLLTALLAACATACTGTSAPTGTEAVKQQASADAQEAFRSYIDAVNDVDVADPSTFEPAFALTTGDMNSLDRAQYARWNTDGWTKSGDSVITLLELAGYSDDLVQLRVCLDVSAVTLVDAQGQSRTGDVPVPVQPLTATLEREDDGWKVASIERRTTDPPC